MNCTVHAHNAGLFSLINKVMVCFGRYARVHVDWSKGTQYTPPGVNLWTELFEQIDLPEEGSDQVTEYPDLSITGIQAGALYEKKDGWRHQFYSYWSCVSARLEILTMADDFARQWDSPHVVSMLVRATLHALEQPSQRCQALEDYAEAFERVRRPDSILHVMACDTQTIEWFRERYERVTFYPATRRSPSRDLDCNNQDQQTLEDARICLTEVLLLARSSVFIHGVSNMATGALYINPDMESVYLP